jgi:hypothetical protein
MCWDTHYNTPELRQACHRWGWELIATRRGPYPHRDGGGNWRYTCEAAHLATILQRTPGKKFHHQHPCPIGPEALERHQLTHLLDTGCLRSVEHGTTLGCHRDTLLAQTLVVGLQHSTRRRRPGSIGAPSYPCSSASTEDTYTTCHT